MQLAPCGGMLSGGSSESVKGLPTLSVTLIKQPISVKALDFLFHLVNVTFGARYEGVEKQPVASEIHLWPDRVN